MFTTKTDWPEFFKYMNEHNMWKVERLENGAMELLLFEAFYAGMDALVDWVREDEHSADWDPGYVSRSTAMRKFNEWREGNNE